MNIGLDNECRCENVWIVQKNEDLLLCDNLAVDFTGTGSSRANSILEISEEEQDNWNECRADYKRNTMYCTCVWFPNPIQFLVCSFFVTFVQYVEVFCE